MFVLWKMWKNHGRNNDVNTSFHHFIFYLWPNAGFEPYAVTILKRPNGKSPGNWMNASLIPKWIKVYVIFPYFKSRVSSTLLLFSHLHNFSIPLNYFLPLSLSLSLSLSLFLYHFYFSNIPIFVSICCNQEVEAESLLTLPKYIVLFSCFASLFAVDFYSSCKKEEFLYDFHNITVRYQFVQKIFIFIIGVFDTMIFIIEGRAKISTEYLLLGMKWILYLFILILCKNDLVGFFFFRKRKLSLLKWQSNFIHFQLLSTTFWSLEVYKRKFFSHFSILYNPPESFSNLFIGYDIYYYSLRTIRICHI